MAYRLDYTHYNSIFAVPTVLVDQHLKLCGALQLKVLLLLLRHSSDHFTAEQLAALLGVSAGDVRDALQYWISAGLVCNTEQAASPPALSASDLAPALTPQPVASRPLSVPEEPSKEIPIIQEGERKVVLVSDRPRLTREESNTLMSEDHTLCQLIQETQVILGKPLTHTECDTIVALYHYYGFHADFILMAIGYCKSIGKGNLRYIEKTIAGWAENGVDTFEKAETYIHQLDRRNTNEEKIRSAFGLGGRALVPSEKKYISTWFEQYGFDLDLIRLAYERTIENIGELKFPYLNKILTSWHEQGIHTAQQAAQEMGSRKKSTPAQTVKGNSSFDAQELQDRILDDFMKLQI